MIPAILIIDDRECELFEAAFFDADIDIVCLHSCKDALDYLENNKVKVIITDLALPVMDGLTFLEKINTDKYRVAAITGHAVTSIVAGLLQAVGVEKIFIKGNDVAVLVQQVRDWLEK